MATQVIFFLRKRSNAANNNDSENQFFHIRVIKSICNIQELLLLSGFVAVFFETNNPKVVKKLTFRPITMRSLIFPAFPPAYSVGQALSYFHIFTLIPCWSGFCVLFCKIKIVRFALSFVSDCNCFYYGQLQQLKINIQVCTGGIPR